MRIGLRCDYARSAKRTSPAPAQCNDGDGHPFAIRVTVE